MNFRLVCLLTATEYYVITCPRLRSNLCTELSRLTASGEWPYSPFHRKVCCCFRTASIKQLVGCLSSMKLLFSYSVFKTIERKQQKSVTEPFVAIDRTTLHASLNTKSCLQTQVNPLWTNGARRTGPRRLPGLGRPAAVCRTRAQGLRARAEHGALQERRGFQGATPRQESPGANRHSTPTLLGTSAGRKFPVCSTKICVLLFVACLMFDRKLSVSSRRLQGNSLL